MKKCFLFFVIYSLAFPIYAFAENFLEKDLLTQMVALEDTCVYEVQDNKYYLNADKICVIQEGIYLVSDYFGPLSLVNLMQDEGGVYIVSPYSYWRCDHCSALYRSRPAVCKICGGTSFTPVEHLPPD